MTANVSARDTALEVLIRCRTHGAWADAALRSALNRNRLSNLDAALCSRLVYGVFQNQILLDFILANYCTQRLEHLQPPLLDILRMGAYQILFLNKIPDSAAVHTAVELAKKYRRASASGLINAVLRKISRNQEAGTLPALPDQKRDIMKYLSIRYSHPRWLVKKLVGILGPGETEEFLSANNGIPDLTVRVNTMKITPDDLIMKLQSENITAKKHDWVPNTLDLINAGNPAVLQSFRDGLFIIQDPAAALVAYLCEAKPGNRVLDVCAAPGGKSFAMAFDMKNQGEIISCDIHENKLRHIRDGTARLGIEKNITTYAVDARVFRSDWKEAFDIVLVDAPCSGMGIIRKKPDSRYKKPDRLFTLPVIQHAILENTARYVRPGGRLVYSTCTILPEENEQVISLFLSEQPEFYLETGELPSSNHQEKPDVFDGQITLWPQRHQTDGFYICRMRRKNPEK